jgi:hypothetical protein
VVVGLAGSRRSILGEAEQFGLSGTLEANRLDG